MRITIDASSLSHPRPTGIGRCLESILPHLAARTAGRDEIILVSGRPLVSQVARELVARGLVTPRTANVPSLYAWQQTGMAWQLARLRPDVHYAPDGLLPLGFRGRSVGTLHDILWRRHPETLPGHVRLVFALRQRASLARLTIPLAISAFTRRELLRAFGPLAARTRVTVLDAVDHARFRPPTPADAPALAAFRARHSLPEGYVLCVGNLMPHKNLAVVLRALARLAPAAGAPRLALVGQGDAAALTGQLPPGLAPDRVVPLGYLSDDDLALAYRGAAALVFPSRYEGFGLPVLEAMASGTPVVHADTSALPETAGGAGLAFPADDETALTGLLERLARDEALRGRLAELGQARAAAFSWEACADTLHAALAEASGLAPPGLPTVSLVTPSFNQAEYLGQTLASVAGQKGVTVEHLVLDGGSSDGSLDVLRRFAPGLAFWRSAPDAGQTAALAEGFALATGEVLGWLNSDDTLWDDGALAAVAEAFARHPEAVMVTGDTVLTDAAGRPVMIDLVLAPSARQMRFAMAVPQQSTFFRRSAYLEAGGLDPAFAYCMDFDLFERLSRQGRILRLPRILATFRQHATAKTATWQEVFRREVAACQHRYGRGAIHEIAIKLVTLEIRLGSILAQLGAALHGRALPTPMNARLEPLRWWARKKHGLTG
jgi:glycosyltransferase involved in cell wall biosynthesis/GT2 family glycosyltransferase